MVRSRWSVNLTTLFLGRLRLKRLTSTSPVTDKCLTWIGKGRMAVEMMSCPVSTKNVLPDRRIQHSTVWIPGGRASDRTSDRLNTRRTCTRLNYRTRLQLFWVTALYETLGVFFITESKLTTNDKFEFVIAISVLKFNIKNVQQTIFSNLMALNTLFWQYLLLLDLFLRYPKAIG